MKGLSAQEVSLERAEGLVDVKGGLVAPEASMLVLQVPVSLHAISPGVSTYVHCGIKFEQPTGELAYKYSHRLLPLTERGYEGVVSFHFEDDPSDDLLPQDLSSYECVVIFCGEGITSNSARVYEEFDPNRCAIPRPHNPGDSRMITADPDFPLNVGLIGYLQD